MNKKPDYTASAKPGPTFTFNDSEFVPMHVWEDEGGALTATLSGEVDTECRNQLA